MYYEIEIKLLAVENKVTQNIISLQCACIQFKVINKNIQSFLRCTEIKDREVDMNKSYNIHNTLITVHVFGKPVLIFKTRLV